MIGNYKPIGLLVENEKGEIIFVRIRESDILTPVSDSGVNNPDNFSESGIVNIPTPKDLKFEKDKEEAKDKTLDSILEKHKKP